MTYLITTYALITVAVFLFVLALRFHGTDDSIGWCFAVAGFYTAVWPAVFVGVLAVAVYYLAAWLITGTVRWIRQRGMV